MELQRYGLFLSVCILTSCYGHNELQRDLEKRVRVFSADLCDVISQWFTDTETAEESYKNIRDLINHLADQYDENLPQRHFFKLVLEKVSFGKYERPKGDLSPLASQMLDDWLKQHSYKDIQMMQIILLAELVEAAGDRKKALILMTEQVDIALKERSQTIKED